MPEVNEQFINRYRRAWTEEDVVELNHLFEKYLFASLKEYTDPIPGVIPTLEKLRAEGLKIGSTTGYTREMMDVVLPEAQAKDTGWITVPLRICCPPVVLLPI